MPLVRLSMCVPVAMIVVLAGGVGGSDLMLRAQVLDAGSQHPTERRVVVGTSEISGTVTAVDTGLPIRGACVVLFGEAARDGLEISKAVLGSSGTPNVQRLVTVPSITVAPVVIGRRDPQPSPADRPEDSTEVWRRVFTDSGGQFVFPRLPAGQFTLSVSHRHYLETEFGQRRPDEEGRVIRLADGERLKLAVSMTRAAVVTGRVIGPDGEPVRNAEVRFWRFVWNDGFRHLESARSASTDDRGVYRAFNLEPGEYVVSAVPRDLDDARVERDRDLAALVEKAIVSGRARPPAARGFLPTVSIPILIDATRLQAERTPDYLQTFAPSVLAPSAAAKLTLVSGEEKTGVDICLRLIEAGDVEVAVQTPIDPGLTLQMWLVTDDPTIDGSDPENGWPDGRAFKFPSVLPGTYTVFALTKANPVQPSYVNGVLPQPQTKATNPRQMWGRASVAVVSGATTRVSLSLEPGRSISGVVAFDTAKPPDFAQAQLRVAVIPAPSPHPFFPGFLPVAQIGADGRFTMTDVAPGRYSLRVLGGTMTAIKSSIIAGQDTLDFPFELTGDRDVTDAIVTLTNTVSELSGTLTDNAGKPAHGFTIVVAASDTRYWTPRSRRIVVARPSPDGRYTIRSLPPGAYVIAAVSDLEDGAQYDPEFLRTLSAVSVPVTIMEGAKVTQNLRVK
jgi:hypothetical protein